MKSTRRNNQVNNQQKRFLKLHAHVVMMQMSIKEGIRKFGHIRNDALLKELNQLH